METSITYLSLFWRFLADFLCFLYYNRATGSQRSVLAMKKKTALTKMHIAPSTVCYDAVAARDSNEVGLILAAVRKKNGYSLVAFSKLLYNYGVDVSDKGISKWEKGYTTPSIYQLVAICHALNIKEEPSYFTKAFQKPALLNDIGQKSCRVRNGLDCIPVLPARRRKACENRLHNDASIRVASIGRSRSFS